LGWGEREVAQQLKIENDEKESIKLFEDDGLYLVSNFKPHAISQEEVCNLINDMID
jgi:hypothetical protein